jgi:hypothetical protein
MLIGTIIAPGRQTTKVLQAMNTGFSQSIKVAMGGAVIEDVRSSAEKFHEDAMRAIGEFWKGFTEEV